MKKSYHKLDADIQAKYKYEQSQACQTTNYCCFKLTKKSDNSQHTGYALKGMLNPTCTFKEFFQSATSTHHHNYLCAQFATFMLTTILCNPLFSQIQGQLINKYIFGQQPTQQQNKLFMFCTDLSKKIKQGKIKMGQAQSCINKQFDSFLKLSEYQSEEISNAFYWKSMHQLYNYADIIPPSHRLTNLQNLFSKLAIYDCVLTQKLSIGMNRSLYEHDTLIIIPNQIQRDYFTIKQIQIMTQNNSTFRVNAQVMAKKLWSALIEFKKDAGFYYPCLSPQNIRYKVNSETINFSILSLVLHVQKIYKIPQDRYDLLNDKSTNEMQYWRAPQRLFEVSQNRKVNLKMGQQTSSQSLLWQFIVLVDQFQHPNSSYFEKNNYNLRTLKESQKYVDFIVKNRLQKKYFSSCACKIFEYFRSTGRLSWFSQTKRPTIQQLRSLY